MSAVSTAPTSLFKSGWQCVGDRIGALTHCDCSYIFLESGCDFFSFSWYCLNFFLSSRVSPHLLKCVCVCTYVCVCDVAHMSACVYIHINVYVYLSVRALFLGVCSKGVFDFKAQKMKPKTWEKLTKHTDPRWLMGREEMTSWPAS